MAIISNFPSDTSNGGGLAPSPVSDIKVVSSYQKVYLKWTDPEDTVYDGKTLAKWKGTILKRNPGAPITSRPDGDTVLELTGEDKNKYKDVYFCDSGLNEGITYYYRFFPYSTDGYYSMSETNNVYPIKPESVAPSQATNLYAEGWDSEIYFSWRNPANTVAEDDETVIVSKWAGTKVVYKENEPPALLEDGTIDGTVYYTDTDQNLGSNNSVVISGLTNDTTYYIAAFPFAEGGAINTDNSNAVSATPFLTYISTKPSYSGTITYNGEWQTPTWKNYNEEQLDISGDYDAIDAGTYTAYFTPRPGYAWSDGSKDEYAVEWTIKKASTSIILNPNISSLTLDLSNNADNPVVLTATIPNEGDFNIIPSEEGLIDISTWYIINDDMLDIEISLSVPENGSSGAVTLTLSAEPYNYNIPSKTLTITIEGLPENEGFYDMSWADISTVSKMGLARDYFEIGMQKTITIGGTYYTVEIIGFDHDPVIDSEVESYGQSYAGITIVMRDVYEVVYPMNNSRTNTGGWAECDLRNDLLAGIYQSLLSSDLKSVIVPVQKWSNIGGGADSTDATDDYLFLLSITEIHGDGAWSWASEGEGSQYEYYASGNSAVKNTGSAIPSSWWSRSSEIDETNRFCYTTETGDANSNYANESYGLAFAFCV